MAAASLSDNARESGNTRAAGPVWGRAPLSTCSLEMNRGVYPRSWKSYSQALRALAIWLCSASKLEKRRSQLEPSIVDSNSQSTWMLGWE